MCPWRRCCCRERNTWWTDEKERTLCKTGRTADGFGGLEAEWQVKVELKNDKIIRKTGSFRGIFKMPVFFMGIEGSAIHYFMLYCVRKVFWFIGFGCQKVASKFLIVKLYKAGAVLFRCPKIRKSKSACVKFSQSDVYVLNSRQLWHDDVHGTLRLLLPSMAAKHCASTGKLRFSNFLPKSQKQSRLCAICQPLN